MFTPLHWPRAVGRAFLPRFLPAFLLAGLLAVTFSSNVQRTSTSIEAFVDRGAVLEFLNENPRFELETPTGVAGVRG